MIGKPLQDHELVRTVFLMLDFMRRSRDSGKTHTPGNKSFDQDIVDALYDILRPIKRFIGLLKAR